MEDVHAADGAAPAQVAHAVVATLAAELARANAPNNEAAEREAVLQADPGLFSQQYAYANYMDTEDKLFSAKQWGDVQRSVEQILLAGGKRKWSKSLAMVSMTEAFWPRHLKHATEKPGGRLYTTVYTSIRLN